jgi:hypothetical protein
MSWHPGDRVRVFLPDRSRIGGRYGYVSAWFTGTVREVDPAGLRPGVRVDLDKPLNGASDCFATHAELKAERQEHHA